MKQSSRILARGSATAALAAVLVAVGGLPPRVGAQTPGTHASVGAFRPPTPADRFRQDPARDNLVHPEGYRPGPPDTFGRVDRHGRGPTPLVLLAGLAFDGRLFDPLLPGLEEDFTTYVVTLAGYGGSSAPPMPEPGTSFGERTWLSGAERALEDLLAEEGLERPLVGAFYSDAANVVTHFARAHPERVGGVLLMSASARFPLPAGGATRAERIDAFADQWFRTVTEIMWPSGMFTPDFYARSPEVAEAAWWEVLAPSLPTLIRYTVETWADDLVPVAAGAETPMIVLSPELDFLQGDRLAGVRERFHGGWEAAAEQRAGIEHRVVPGARFLIWEDAPGVVEEALRELARGRGG